MDGDSATGGFMLLGLFLVFFVLPVAVFTTVIVKAGHKVQRFDRNRAIERDLRNEVIDANVRQAAARKILREYEGK